ncbi:MAG: hypothetical protein KAG66_17505, partial [Methylococcales bacterium]|nr:hypothetical protein [Methylococcales bacterium]
LKQATSQNIRVADIDAFTGQAALINTSRAEDRPKLLFADISSNPSHPDYQPDFNPEKDEVAYWVQGENEETVEIIGLFWQGDAPAKLFYGLIGPP